VVRTAVPGSSMVRMGSPVRFRRGLHTQADQQKRWSLLRSMRQLPSREPIRCWEALGLPLASRCLSIALTSDVGVPFPSLSGLLACSAVQNPYVGDQGVASETAAVAKVVPGHQVVRVVGLASLSPDPSPTARTWPRPRRHLQPSSQPFDVNLLLAAATPRRAAGQRDTGSSSTASGSGTGDRAVQRPQYPASAPPRATRRGGRWRRGSGRPSPRGPGRRAPPARSRRHPARPAGAGRRRPRRCPGCRCRPRCP
jgi:hypothetical protein